MQADFLGPPRHQSADRDWRPGDRMADLKGRIAILKRLIADLRRPSPPSGCWLNSIDDRPNWLWPEAIAHQ
jgi:hypothetical protein